MTSATAAHWLAEARRAADRPRAAGRVPLWFGAADRAVEIGSLDEAVARRVQAAALPLAPHAGPAVQAARAEGWRIDGGQAELDAIAEWLIAHGICSRRRDERLAVEPVSGAAGGAAVATVERGVVRVLGVATVAVHLVGLAADGERVWVQQRAFDKATDPGRWDTLMGGQVAHGETVQSALVRETLEEAGLDATAFASLVPAPAVRVRRPVAEGEMVERVDVYVARLAPAMVPRNLDGEVAAFDLLTPPALAARLAAGAFTLEATLIHGAWLERHHPDLLR